MKHSAKRARVACFLTCLLALTLNAFVAAGAPASAAPGSGVSVVSRISGADRFEVAANIARALPAGGNDIVVIASGANYPDALSAAPAAVYWRASLLLVTPNEVPPSVLASLSSHAPAEIWVIGGENSVSRAVFDQIQALAPEARMLRFGGADRYEVSRNLVNFAFTGSGKTQVAIATGRSFPDALSAGPAASQNQNPVLIVPGDGTRLDGASFDTLSGVGAKSFRIVGGPNSISTGTEAGIATIAPTTRIGGADRFEVAININQAAFASAKTAYLATGLNYPDALAGGTLAGRTASPLYVVPSDCVPRGVLREFDRLGTTHVVLLGGPASLSQAVYDLTPCSF